MARGFARHPIPKWYRDSGAGRANKETDKDGNIWQPDFSDPLYLKYWGEPVSEAGKRNDGNPFLDTVDISSVGYWGESWSPYIPPFPNQKALADIWVAAFPHTDQLALELKSSAASAVIQVPAKLKEWLPGDAVVDRSLYVPENLAPGKYSVRIAILDIETGKPAIQRANQGRDPDGWYARGSLQIGAD